MDFKGTKKQSTGTYLKTGLTEMTFLGANPSAAQIEEWTGRDNVSEPNYNLVDDINGNRVRPIHLWFSNGEVVKDLRFNIGNKPEIAKSGNYQICTSTGSVVWAMKDGIVKPEFADHKQLVIGESDLLQFIRTLINFDVKSGENLYQQVSDNKCDAETLFDGDVSGLNSLSKWCADNNKTISMVLSVSARKATDESGNVTERNYQVIESDPRTWFHGAPSDWSRGVLKSRFSDSTQVKPGQTQAYPLIKNMFTVEYIPFDRELCYNNIPDNSSNTPQNTGGTWS